MDPQRVMMASARGRAARGLAAPRQGRSQARLEKEEGWAWGQHPHPVKQIPATKTSTTGAATVGNALPAQTNRHRECALCLEKLKSPRILPCFHTFCLQCLTGLVENQQRTDSFPCPTCRTKIEIPPGGVSKFQVNFYIEAEVDAESLMSQPLACATGCTMAATHKCFECDQLMCEYCKRVHGTIPVTKSHTVLSLNSSAANAHMITRDRFCDKHPQEIIRFFCQTCKSIICRDCKLTSHEGHPSCDLSSMAAKGKQFLSSICKMFEDSLEPKLREELSSAEDHQNKWVKNVEVVRQQLIKRADDVKKAVDLSLNQALKKLEEETKDVKCEVDKAIEEMQQQMACCQSLFEHAKRVAEKGVDADILDFPSKLESYFEMSYSETEYEYFEEYSQETHKLDAFTDGKWRRSVEWFQPNSFSGREDLKTYAQYYIGDIQITNPQQTGYNMHHQNTYNGRFGYPRDRRYGDGRVGDFQTGDIQSIINNLQDHLKNWKRGCHSLTQNEFEYY